MIKDKLIDGKNLWVDLEVNEWKWLKIMVVNMIIIQFHLKLDRFHCIEFIKIELKIMN